MIKCLNKLRSIVLVVIFTKQKLGDKLRINGLDATNANNQWW